jgi:hypothetical protein
MFFGEIFLNYLKNPCSFIFSLIRLAPETIRSKKKFRFTFHPSFYVQYGPGSGMKTVGIRTQNEKFRDPDPG